MEIIYSVTLIILNRVFSLISGLQYALGTRGAALWLHYYKHLLIMQTPPLLSRSFSTVMKIFWLPVGFIIKIFFFFFFFFFWKGIFVNLLKINIFF